MQYTHIISLLWTNMYIIRVSLITYWEVLAEGALGFKGIGRTFIAWIKLLWSGGGLKLENVFSLDCRKKNVHKENQYMYVILRSTIKSTRNKAQRVRKRPYNHWSTMRDLLPLTWEEKWFLDITLWENGRSGLSMARSEETTTSARNCGLSVKVHKKCPVI